jgi:putative phage-type endonuclease
MPILVKTQRTDEWWAAHLNRITGSTAAGCLGVCKDFAPITAYKQIKQLVAEKSNWFIEYGHRMEKPARMAYEKLTNQIVWETGFWVHPFLPWLGASPDGISTGALEIKCPQTLPTEVPTKHYYQCMVVMAVCNLPYCDYFAWNPQCRPAFFARRIPRNLVHEAAMLVKLQQFYKDHILTDVPPKRRKRVSKPKETLTDESRLDGNDDTDTDTEESGERKLA